MTRTTKITQTATNNSVECWIRENHGNHRNDANDGIRGAKHGFPTDFLYLSPPRLALNILGVSFEHQVKDSASANRWRV